MPRGKKRSAKENLTAGGKKPTTEKTDERGRRKEPKPYVCAIYRRDIASFLPREKVQQWRLTSCRSNASLIEFPSLLPRFKYHSLAVIFASSHRCTVKKNGFLDISSDRRSMHGTEFNSIFKFRFCCRDVRDRASELVGQRLFPKKPENEGVAFHLCLNPGTWRWKTLVCHVSNLLTKKTAPAMLHFLHHLSQACYEYIEIEPGATADAAECTFNPLVLGALSEFQLRGVKFGRADSWDAELSSLMVKMAFEMRIRFKLLSFHTYYFLDMQLLQLLDLITNGGQLEKRLAIDALIRSQDVDQIIKHFEEDVHSLEGAIRDVHYESSYNHADIWTNWPARCPREAAMKVTRNGDGVVDYRFDFTSAHSGEPFSVLLRVHSCEGRTQIHRFKLRFGSA